MTPQDREFYLQEHSALTQEISAQLNELWGFEKFGLGGAAAIAAWLAANNVVIEQIWWLPFIFLCLCCLRFGAGMIHIIFRLSKYIQTIEKKFIPGTGGYETWFRNQSLVQTLAHLVVWVSALLLAFLTAKNGTTWVALVHPN